MPNSRTRPPTPPTDFRLPPEVTSTRATLANGAIAYSFRHARLGLLGRLVVGTLGEQTEVTSEVSGDTDDPVTAERLAIFRPISEALTAILDQRSGGDPTTDAARSTDTPTTSSRASSSRATTAAPSRRTSSSRTRRRGHWRTMRA